MSAIKRNAFELKNAPPELRADRDIVLAALHQSVYALKYAFPELRADRLVSVDLSSLL